MSERRFTAEEMSERAHGYSGWTTSCDMLMQAAETERVLSALGVRKEGGRWTMPCPVCKGRGLCRDDITASVYPDGELGGVTVFYTRCFAGRTPVPGMEEPK